jgi:hypothetical protein
VGGRGESVDEREVSIYSAFIVVQFCVQRDISLEHWL